LKELYGSKITGRGFSSNIVRNCYSLWQQALTGFAPRLNM
jgi:hypothetical protein